MLSVPSNILKFLNQAYDRQEVITTTHPKHLAQVMYCLVEKKKHLYFDTLLYIYLATFLLRAMPICTYSIQMSGVNFFCFHSLL